MEPLCVLSPTVVRPQDQPVYGIQSILYSLCTGISFSKADLLLPHTRRGRLSSKAYDLCGGSLQLTCRVLLVQGDLQRLRHRF